MVIPHLMFDGKAEEALNRYRQAFDVEVIHLGRYGPQMAISEEQAQKILHAEVKLDDNLVLMADCF